MEHGFGDFLGPDDVRDPETEELMQDLRNFGVGENIVNFIGNNKNHLTIVHSWIYRHFFANGNVDFAFIFDVMNGQREVIKIEVGIARNGRIDLSRFNGQFPADELFDLRDELRDVDLLSFLIDGTNRDVWQHGYFNEDADYIINRLNEFELMTQEIMDFITALPPVPPSTRLHIPTRLRRENLSRRGNGFLGSGLEELRGKGYSRWISNLNKLKK